MESSQLDGSFFVALITARLIMSSTEPSAIEAAPCAAPTTSDSAGPRWSPSARPEVGVGGIAAHRASKGGEGAERCAFD